MSCRALITVVVLLVPYLLPSASALAHDDDLAAVAAALEHPDVAGEIVLAKPLTVGRAELRPEAGSRVFALAAAGRRCGVVMDGPVSLLYHVTDRLSRELVRRNAGRAGGIEVRETSDETLISAALRGAAVWGWDVGAGDVTSSPPVPLPSWLEAVLTRKADSNPARDMLLGDRNGEPGYRWAVLHGKSDDFGLDVDPSAAVQVESLYVYEKIARGGVYAGRLTYESLVDQPIGRRWWDAPKVGLASTDTKIAVRNDAGSHAIVETRTRITPLRAGVRLLPLSLISASFSDNGERHPLTIKTLRVDGADAPFVHSWGSLLVQLPKAAGPSDSLLVEIDAEGDILEFRGGDTYWVLGTSSWYPRPSANGIEWADFNVSLTAPPGLVPFVAGDPIEEPAENRNIASGSLKGPMERAVVGAGRHHRFVNQRDNARVVVATYGTSKREEAERLAGIVHGVRGCFEQLLGVPYPFRYLQLIEMNEWGWGQAPPGVVFITKDALLSQAGAALVAEQERADAATTSRTANERIAHEVAHGWFPHVAKVDRGEENWLSESLAEYMSTVCLESASADRARGRLIFRRQVSRWKDRTGLIGDHASIYLASRLGGGESNARARWALWYGKGPLVLQALREELARSAGDKEGDRLFFTWIRSYVKNFLYKRGGTAPFIAVLNQVTAKDWQPWFERYVYGTETPSIR